MLFEIALQEEILGEIPIGHEKYFTQKSGFILMGILAFIKTLKHRPECTDCPIVVIYDVVR